MAKNKQTDSLKYVQSSIYIHNKSFNWIRIQTFEAKSFG